MNVQTWMQTFFWRGSTIENFFMVVRFWSYLHWHFEKSDTKLIKPWILCCYRAIFCKFQIFESNIQTSSETEMDKISQAGDAQLSKKWLKTYLKIQNFLGNSQKVALQCSALICFLWSFGSKFFKIKAKITYIQIFQIRLTDLNIKKVLDILLSPHRYNHNNKNMSRKETRLMVTCYVITTTTYSISLYITDFDTSW